MKGEEEVGGSSGHRFSLADEAPLTKDPCEQHNP
jgi:hypothetical protein